MDKSNIPEPVLRSFKYFIDRFGGRVVYVGEDSQRRGSVYSYEAPPALDIGFPDVCIWDGHDVVCFDGFAAQELLHSMSENS